MAIAAAIKFVQGATIGTAGQALYGVLTTPVTVSNGNNSNVQRWKWTMVAVPPGSTVAEGVMADGPFNSVQFIPDVRGGYHVELIVFDAAGNQKKDRKVFQVPETSGLSIPPFDANAAALNFAGQLDGWELMVRPFLSTWGMQLEFGFDIPFVLGLQSTTSSVLTRLGGRNAKFGMFPATIPRAGANPMVRNARLKVMLEGSVNAAVGECDLYNLDTGTILTNSFVTNAGAADRTIPFEWGSGGLLFGTGANELRTDGEFRYLFRARRNGGAGTDLVIVTHARIVVTYVPT